MMPSSAPPGAALVPGRSVGITDDGVTTRILFGLIVGQISWIRSRAERAFRPDRGSIRTLPDPVRPSVPVSPIFSSIARI